MSGFSDSLPLDRPIYSKGEVIIRKNVWIGDNVIILAGVEIGECSVVGAQSVVTKSIPAYSICAGIPAKVIKLFENNNQNDEQSDKYNRRSNS